MPTPLDKIRDGIAQNNMDLVYEGYRDLTGQEVDFLSVLAEVVEEAEEKPAPKKRGRKPKAPEKAKDDFSMPSQVQIGEKRQCKREKLVLEKKNEFKDDPKEAAEDRKFDKKVIRSKPAPRRPEPKKIVLVCGGCERSFRVSENEVYSTTYTCPSCMKAKYYSR